MGSSSRSGAGKRARTEPGEDPYARLAAFYDLETSAFEDDLSLYLGLADRTSGPILELACGTGRLLAPLARAGHTVAGVDRSRTMLCLARRRLGEEGLNVPIVQGDMRNVPLNQRFGLIAIALDSFLHLETTADQLAALREARRLLARRGVLVLDLPSPAAPGWEDWSPGVRPLVLAWSVKRQDSSRLSKFSSFVADASAQIHQVTEIYERIEVHGASRRWVVEYPLRLVFPAELELLLAAAGLRLIDRFGDYDLSAFGPSSPRQICTAVIGPAKAGRENFDADRA